VVESAGAGNDTVFSTVNFTLSANVETLILQGSADLQGYGNSLVNTLYGNAGSNLLSGGVGADLMVGGAGNDTYFVDNIADSAFESAGAGNDTVFSTANYALAADIESLILQGGANLQAYGNNQANTIYGNSGNNLINGGGGADTMVGGAGNDTYFVDNIGDGIVENANAGTDAVFAGVSYALSANVETLVLQGAGNIDGIGNTLNNSVFGNSGANTLDGGAGADQLTGNLGNDIFVFHVGQANGDTIVDFAGNGAAAGDQLSFFGYGPSATFTNVDATHWQVSYAGGAAHELITFMNGAAVDHTDVLFA
jgi:Ca2+-binding RTX toxin-like protein